MCWVYVLGMRCFVSLFRVVFAFVLIYLFYFVLLLGSHFLYCSSTAGHSQHEKAFQKQDAIFIGSKRLLANKKKGIARYVKDPGLGFAIPQLARDGHYVDKKCPFTSNVSIRGRILK